MEIRYCTNCGTRLMPEYIFCSECGFRVISNEAAPQTKFSMVVEDVFMLVGTGIVITGTVKDADLKTGSELEWYHQSLYKSATVSGISHGRTRIEGAHVGEDIAILLKGILEKDISKGCVVKAK